MTDVAATGPQPASATTATRRAIRTRSRYPGSGTVSNGRMFTSCRGASALLPSNPMLAIALSLLATAPLAQVSDQQLDANIAAMHQLPFTERIERLSQVFLGTPYGELPLGEG